MSTPEVKVKIFASETSTDIDSCMCKFNAWAADKNIRIINIQASAPNRFNPLSILVFYMEFPPDPPMITIEDD